MAKKQLAKPKSALPQKLVVSPKQKILDSAKTIFATSGYEGLSMRNLAKDCGVNLSNIYYYFNDKDELLEYLFNRLSKDLGIKRAVLPIQKTANQSLKDRINFQFENIEDVIFILKFYLHFRPEFIRNKDGYVPATAYLHILEVLELGNKTGEFKIKNSNLVAEAKVVTHAINGFLLEYYPDPPSGNERKKIVNYIHRFIYRSLSSTGGNL